jgi:hypothetical protein
MFRASSCPSSGATTTAVAVSGLPSERGDGSAVSKMDTAKLLNLIRNTITVRYKLLNSWLALSSLYTRTARPKITHSLGPSTEHSFFDLCHGPFTGPCVVCSSGSFISTWIPRTDSIFSSVDQILTSSSHEVGDSQLVSSIRFYYFLRLTDNV